MKLVYIDLSGSADELPVSDPAITHHPSTRDRVAVVRWQETLLRLTLLLVAKLKKLSNSLPHRRRA